MLKVKVSRRIISNRIVHPVLYVSSCRKIVPLPSDCLSLAKNFLYYTAFSVTGRGRQDLSFPLKEKKNSTWRRQFCTEVGKQLSFSSTSLLPFEYILSQLLWKIIQKGKKDSELKADMQGHWNIALARHKGCPSLAPHSPPSATELKSCGSGQ